MSSLNPSIYNSYLVPSDDAVIFSDGSNTAGVYSTAGNTSILSNGALAVLQKSWMAPAEFLKVKNVVSDNPEVADLTFRWLERQEGINTTQKVPEIKSSTTTDMKAGETINGGSAGQIKLAESGKLTTIQYVTSNGQTKTINWFASATSLEACGVPRMPNPHSVNPNSTTAFIPEIVPRIKTEALGAKCGACGTCAACAACTACAEINFAAGAAALTAVGALLFLGDVALAARATSAFSHR